MEVRHQPVMVREALEGLNVNRQGVYVDGTVGEGGHAQYILERLGPQGLLIVLDRDAEVLQRAKTRLEEYGDRVRFFHQSYAHLEKVLEQLHITTVSGILLDLGFSSYQVEDPQRGFSFTSGQRLDMRFDRSQAPSAYDLVNRLTRQELKEIFWKFGQERRAAAIADHIVRQRAKAPVETARELADIVTRAVPVPPGKKGIHPATRIFQALRIAVNKELEHLQAFMKEFPRWLSPGGRLVVISYHSLEDGTVKRGLKYWAATCRCPRELPRCVCEGRSLIEILTPRPLSPSRQEVQQNPRARSARLRVAQRI